MELNFKKVYDFIRWHHECPPTDSGVGIDLFPYAQVPEGVVASETNWPADDPKDPYDEAGYLSPYILYKTGSSQTDIITDGSTLETV